MKTECVLLIHLRGDPPFLSEAGPVVEPWDAGSFSPLATILMQFSCALRRYPYSR